LPLFHHQLETCGTQSREGLSPLTSLGCLPLPSLQGIKQPRKTAPNGTSMEREGDSEVSCGMGSEQIPKGQSNSNGVLGWTQPPPTNETESQGGRLGCKPVF
jgi:hypothetical protein